MYFGGFDEAPAPATPATTVETPKVTPAKTPSSTVKRTTPVRKAEAVVTGQQSSTTIPTRPVAHGAAGVTSPLGLKYSVIKVDGVNRTEVSATTKFRSGERIQLKIRPNADGYLYIVHQGTSGDWSVVFPPNKDEPGSNKVEAWQDYTVPSTGTLKFQGAPGVERLFVCLARSPEVSFEELIFAMKDRGGAPSAAPAPNKPASTTMLAQNMEIKNPFVERMRSSTRDLVLEMVEDDTPAKKEHAVYVVNPTRMASARVVADIALNHQ